MTAAAIRLGRSRSSGALVGALGFVVLLRLLTLGLYPLSDTTEARYAEIARKMVELGDWVTEPPRESRRPIGLSQLVMADSMNWR